MQRQLIASLRYAAALALIPLLAAGCSSGAPPGSSGASYTTDPSVALARLVQCLHAHGEQGVYLSHRPANPKPGYTLIVYHGFAVQGADPGSARFAAATQACHHLLPQGIPASGTGQHREFLQGVKAAQCMRSHGYPAWPDPSDQNGSNAQAIPTGIDMNSPQYQAAAKACGVSLPSGGG
jgi:hypothetical protein